MATRFFDRGMISARAAKRTGYAFDSTSSDGKSLRQDDGGVRGNSGEVPGNEINHPTNQAGGRMSRTGGAGTERQEHRDHIDATRNKRPDRESKYGRERTVVDRPTRASLSRVKRNSAHAWSPDWYSAGPNRRG